MSQACWPELGPKLTPSLSSRKHKKEWSISKNIPSEEARERLPKRRKQHGQECEVTEPARRPRRWKDRGKSCKGRLGPDQEDPVCPTKEFGFLSVGKRTSREIFSLPRPPCIPGPKDASILGRKHWKLTLVLANTRTHKKHTQCSLGLPTGCHTNSQTPSVPKATARWPCASPFLCSHLPQLFPFRLP